MGESHRARLLVRVPGFSKSASSKPREAGGIDHGLTPSAQVTVCGFYLDLDWAIGTRP